MNSKNKEAFVRNVGDAVINADLGDYIGNKDFHVSVNVQKKRMPLPPNMMLFQAFAYLAATKLKDSTNRVLMLFFAKSEWENFISMDVQTIMEELQMSERSVMYAIKELISNNIIVKIKHPSDKRRNDYFINPIAAWKGNSFTRAKKIKMMDKNQLQLKFDDKKEAGE